MVTGFLDCSSEIHSTPLLLFVFFLATWLWKQHFRLELVRSLSEAATTVTFKDEEEGMFKSSFSNDFKSSLNTLTLTHVHLNIMLSMHKPLNVRNNKIRFKIPFLPALPKLSVGLARKKVVPTPYVCVRHKCDFLKCSQAKKKSSERTYMGFWGVWVMMSYISLYFLMKPVGVYIYMSLEIRDIYVSLFPTENI